MMPPSGDRVILPALMSLDLGHPHPYLEPAPVWNGEESILPSAAACKELGQLSDPYNPLGWLTYTLTTRASSTGT